MEKIKKIAPAVLILLLAGCATLPTGPRVMVLPAPGTPFEQFQADDYTCRQWAERQIGISPQERANQSTATGAVAGAAVGAGLGAAIGSTSGDAGAGAAIGAVTGLIVGASSGASAGQYSGWEAQRRYDIAYVQCMYAKGHQVPGSSRSRRIERSAPPSRPPDLDYDPPLYRGPVPPPPPPGRY